MFARIAQMLFRFLALVSFAAMAVGAAPPQAQSGGAQFELFGSYEVKVNGTLDSSARLYRAERPPLFLVLGEPFSTPVLLNPVTTEVGGLQQENVRVESQRSVQLLPGYRFTPTGKFTVTEADVSFEFDSANILLTPKPFVVKEAEASDIIAYDPTWGWRADDYKPDAASIQSVKAFPKECRVTVYFGCWCPHCQATVPNIIRVERELAGSKLNFDYYGLPRNFGDEPAAREKHIERIPTAIVTVDGKEIGRMFGDDCKEPEKNLRKLLASLSSGGH